MYTPNLDEWNIKTFYYDFTHMSLRVDSVFYAGLPIPPLNFSSYWIGNTLSMFTFDGNGSCFQMDMGFGMMRPDWFVDGEQQNTTWLGKKTDTKDINLHNTVWTRKCATCDEDPNGYFDYFSLAGNGTDKQGEPFRLEAPGPLPILYVINEYYNFQPANYTVNDPTFRLPSSITCQTTDVDDSVYEAVQALPEAHKRQAIIAAKVDKLHDFLIASKRPFPEVLMALV